MIMVCLQVYKTGHWAEGLSLPTFQHECSAHTCLHRAPFADPHLRLLQTERQGRHKSAGPPNGQSETGTGASQRGKHTASPRDHRAFGGNKRR